ncbi:MAG: response regulator transcription factor [Sporolactobacillus sp.]
MAYDCLIVDDEELLSRSTRDYFQLFGVTCAWVASAEDCLAFLEQHTVRLVLLDVNLGGMSGFALCRTLREKTDLPILFISARGSEQDMVYGLDIGGDDYIPKPYLLRVLLAKVQARLRRHEKAGPVVTFGACTLDCERGRLTRGGSPVTLTTMERRLLIYFAEHAGFVLAKEELFQNVWGAEAFIGDGTLNVHVRRLREKIEPDPGSPRYIKTVRGSGYVFEAEGFA